MDNLRIVGEHHCIEQGCDWNGINNSFEKLSSGSLGFMTVLGSRSGDTAILQLPISETLASSKRDR